MDDIPLIIEGNVMSDSINSFKAALMLTIEKLRATIDFLQNELKERNLHLRTVLLRDANDGRSIDMELLDKTQDVMKTIHSTTIVQMFPMNKIRN